MTRPVRSVTPQRAWLRAALALVAGLAAAMTSLPLAARQSPDPFRGLHYRAIGPTAQGGRFVDFAVVEATPRMFYAATGSGGLWKTEDNGLHWQPVFDDQPVISIGAVAVSQSNPSVVYVGTGEANNSRSTYSGNGVYKSTDAGASWTHVGLDASQHIGRVVVHPTDPNTAYVASLGPLYSDNDTRGVYKTTDGGATWSKSLAVDFSGRPVGVVDVAMDPRNPDVLYAAAYDKVRKPWTFAEGGPGSGIYKTTNAGRSWTRLANGLPANPMGRIGLSVSRTNPNTVYAIVENVGPLDAAGLARYAEGFGAESGSPAELYRSDDAGGTWRQVAPAPAPAQGRGAGAGAGRGGGGGGGRGGFDGGFPPYYYAQVRVDPNDAETVYVLSVGWSRSTDGGATWQRIGFGGDNHALWIDPSDSKHLLLGYDHGMGVSFDGGDNWFSPDNLPLAQFYAVTYDMERPYHVYGGLQDNGCWKGPSTMRGGGTIPFEAWISVGCADGFYNAISPDDSRWLYNSSQFGAISRVDQWTGASQGIQYRRPQGQPQLRWNWSAPIVVSPHDGEVIYHGANVLLRSNTRGESWEEISPDLTQNDPARQGGGGNIQYATITTISESPLVRGLIYVGTDDGNVQLTQDDGATWTNLRDRIPGHPGYWVSRVETSHFDPAVAYVTVTGFRRDDFRPYIWKTTDFGQTWTSIAGNLPDGAINVVREDPRNPNLLFVGSEPGLYATLDGGRTWHDIHADMPTNPVYDLQIQPRERELIVATHGRGIFIADVAALEGLTPEAMAADAALFDIVPEVQWVRGQRHATAQLNFAGESRPSGVTIHYWLKSAPAGDVTVAVHDGARLLAETTGPKAAGVNTVRWTMQSRREATAADNAAGGRGRGRGGFGGGGGFGRGGRGGGAAAVPTFPAAGGGVIAPVGPGTYTVTLTVGGRTYQQTAVVIRDDWFR
ncbi:MAG: hypothetical protein R2752_04165 [Vicinamibacterales bacterium]